VRTLTENPGNLVGTIRSADPTGFSLYDFRHPGTLNENPFVKMLIGVTQRANRQARYLPLPALLCPRPREHFQPVAISPFFRLGDRERSGPLQGDNQVPFVSGIADYETLDGKVVGPNVSIVLWGNGSPAGITLPYGPVERWTMQSVYPILHDSFFANPDVDRFVVAKVSGGSSPVVPGPVYINIDIIACGSPCPVGIPPAHLSGRVEPRTLPRTTDQSLNLSCRPHALRRTIRTGSKAMRASSLNAGRPSRRATTFARS
jgi:hypothetical protein